MNVYAGIGSREAPDWALELATALAVKLRDDWRLSTGHAPGMDQAFEQGALHHTDHYLPWPTFQERAPLLGMVYAPPRAGAHDIAEEYHPHFRALSQGARALHARNSHIVLGWNLDAPVRFVVCWAQTSDDGVVGGTGQAIRLARAHDIPVYNMAAPQHRRRMEAYL